jgi:hypothetical protein
VGYYMAGDYYGAGGIFGDIFGGIVGGVKGFLGGGVTGAISGAVSGFKGQPKSSGQIYTGPMIPSIAPMPQGSTIVPTPGVTGVVQRLVPGGATGYDVVVRKRPRMNVANPKALRRAIRREQGFVKLARRALKGTGYQITTRGSSRRRAINVRESGSGSVIVR